MAHNRVAFYIKNILKQLLKIFNSIQFELEEAVDSKSAYELTRFKL